MARRIEVDDGTSELLKSLLGNFTVKNAVAWLERKFESFDTSRAREIAVGETKNEKEYLALLEFAWVSPVMPQVARLV